MGTTMNELFARNKNLQTAAPEERKQAEYWLNIGYQVEIGEESRFVSLPTGIPLDTQTKFEIKGSNEAFKALRSGQNDLLDMVMEAAGTLQPGEGQILNLQIELRRVQGKQESVASDSNPFSMKGKLQLLAQ